MIGLILKKVDANGEGKQQQNRAAFSSNLFFYDIFLLLGVRNDTDVEVDLNILCFLLLSRLSIKT